MERAGTRLSEPAPKWYREAFRDAKGNATRNPAGKSGKVKGTLA
jgi:hypothetical protein